jgi:hypothetical protein
MNQKENKLTINLYLKINFLNYKNGISSKKTWIISLLVLGLKILALYLKYYGS